MCLLAKQVLLAREGKTSEYSMQYIQTRYLFFLHWQKSWIQNFTLKKYLKGPLKARRALKDAATGYSAQTQKLASKLKVDSLEIIYKEANSISVKVIKTIEVTDDMFNTSNSYINWEYKSNKPIKTLPEDVQTRPA